MKKTVLLAFCILKMVSVFSQQKPRQFGGEFQFQAPHSECLSEERREEIKKEIQESREFLMKEGVLENVQHRDAQSPLVHPLFIWPVTKNPTAPYDNVWSISAHVDHNASFPNQLLDYNCGNRTYDTAGGYNHMGVDIFTWPFAWYQMENNQSWAVAAADGIIVYKSDGNFDKSCGFNSNMWNAVYVEHADGSVSWYGHLKNGSLTTKNIGQSVVAGEFLGVIGSSGNSTGPHLHFEVYNALNQLVDPYTGTCNTWASSSDTWWQLQKPYQDPKINAVLTHSAAPVFNTCPTTETTNLKDVFNNGDNVVTAIYLADQLLGTSGTITLYRPDGTVASTDTINFTTNYTASYWYWNFTAPWFNQNGNWIFSFTYNGNTVNHTFSYGTLGNEEFQNNLFSIYPNPTNGRLNIKSKNGAKIDKVQLFDMTGKQVYSNTIITETVDASALAKGIYLVKIFSEEGNYIGKIIKE